MSSDDRFAPSVAPVKDPAGAHGPARPRVVTVSLLLLWLGCLLSSALGVYFVLTEPMPNPEDLSSPGIVTAGSMAAIFALEALLYLMIARRANWVRWTLLLLTVLGYAAFLAMPGDDVDMWMAESIVEAVSDVISAAGTALLFTPAASRWFKHGRGEDGQQGRAPAAAP